MSVDAIEDVTATAEGTADPYAAIKRGIRTVLSSFRDPNQLNYKEVLDEVEQRLGMVRGALTARYSEDQLKYLLAYVRGHLSLRVRLATWPNVDLSAALKNNNVIYSGTQLQLIQRILAHVQYGVLGVSPPPFVEKVVCNGPSAGPRPILFALDIGKVRKKSARAQLGM